MVKSFVCNEIENKQKWGMCQRINSLMSEYDTKETKEKYTDTSINKGLLAATEMPAPDFNLTEWKIMSS